MTERSSVFEICQIGKESAPGTAVAATKRLGSIKITPEPKVDVKTFSPDGFKYPLVAQVGQDWTDFGYDGVPDYNEMIYILSSLLGVVSPTGASTAKTWAITPDTDGPDTMAAFTMESGSSVRGARWAHGMFTSLEFKLTRKEAKVSGKGVGQKYTDAFSMTGSLADPAPVPMNPSEFVVYLDTSGAGIGSTKLTRVLELTVSFDRQIKALWNIDSANPSFVTVVEGRPAFKLKMKVEADAAGMGILATMCAGSSAFVRVKGTSATLAESPSTYCSTQLDMCLKVSKIGKLGDSDGVYAVEYEFDVAHDATWTKALTWTSVNTVASL